ncbi:Tat pathway signal sequence protein [Rutstroemia sp. NJR-2017a WRK4]|nr:Tat pathway signal sequence protein [Rutstroemia sp. NJR-2017a WRK4]
MSLPSSMLLNRTWGDDTIAAESEEFLLPKNENEHDTTLVRPPAKLAIATKLEWVIIAGILFMMLWGAIAFMVGNKMGQRQRDTPWGSFENGFDEEQVVTPSHIFELIKTTFTGGVDFTPEGVEVLHPSLYVGEPSTEIDEAWNAIIGGESHYFSVSEDEAKKLWGDESDRYRDRIRGGWTGTLDMFHCLHCLNQLRKALRRDYYPEEEHRGIVHQRKTESLKAFRLEQSAYTPQVHCIDHLRQVIMCQGTSVISPSEWHDKRGQYINPKQVHTCRNFQTLHEFSKARYNGSIAVTRTPKVPFHPPSAALPHN